MARIKQTARKTTGARYQGLAAPGHERSTSTDMAGLIYPSDNSQDGMPGPPLPTPRGSATQTPSTPSTTSFARQRQNDRSAIKIHIQKRINLSKPSFLALPITERWEFIRQERKKKVKERVERGKGSAEKDFPGLFDERGEMEWLWRGFADVLEGRGGEGGKGSRRVVRVDYGESSGEDEDDEEEATREEMLKVEGRGDDEDGDGDVDVDVDMEEREDVEAQPEQEVKEEPRRTWRCIDGTMGIYPRADDPEEAELEVEMTKATVKKVARREFLGREDA